MEIEQTEINRERCVQYDHRQTAGEKAIILNGTTVAIVQATEISWSPDKAYEFAYKMLFGVSVRASSLKPISNTSPRGQAYVLSQEVALPVVGDLDFLEAKQLDQ